MSVFVVDVESDGPVPGIYNMLEFGAVMINPNLSFETYHGFVKPVTDNYVEEAIKVTGLTREATQNYSNPKYAMAAFAGWIAQVNNSGRPMFYSDNNGFDWQFINYYFHAYYGSNPFGFSSTNIGSLYKGMKMTMFQNFKHLRKTKHTHNPVDDAMGNAEALIEMDKMGLKIKF